MKQRLFVYAFPDKRLVYHINPHCLMSLFSSKCVQLSHTQVGISNLSCIYPHTTAVLNSLSAYFPVGRQWHKCPQFEHLIAVPLDRFVCLSRDHWCSSSCILFVIACYVSMHITKINRMISAIAFLSLAAISCLLYRFIVSIHLFVVFICTLCNNGENAHTDYKK